MESVSQWGMFQESQPERDTNIMINAMTFYAGATAEELLRDAGRIANYALCYTDPNHIELVPPRRFSIDCTGLAKPMLADEIGIEDEADGEQIDLYVVALDGDNVIGEQSKPSLKTKINV